jgi:hypothetical protein
MATQRSGRNPELTARAAVHEPFPEKTHGVRQMARAAGSDPLLSLDRHVGSNAGAHTGLQNPAMVAPSCRAVSDLCYIEPRIRLHAAALIRNRLAHTW